MKCEKCGYVMENPMNFCPGCGNKLSAGQPAPVAAPVAEKTKKAVVKKAPAAEKPAKKKSGGKAALIVIVVILVLALAAAAVFFAVFEGDFSLLKAKLFMPEPVSETRIQSDIFKYDEIFDEYELEIDDFEIDSRRVNEENMNERVTCQVEASGSDGYQYSAEYKITYVVDGRDWVVDKFKIEELESKGVSKPDFSFGPSESTNPPSDTAVSTPGGTAATETPDTTEAAPEEDLAFEITPFYGDIYDFYPIYAYDAYASSEVEFKGTTYYATNVIDGDNGTSWQEDAEDLGYGEWVDVFFDDYYEIDMLMIRPGYAKDWDLFQRNGRPSQLLVEFGDGNSAVIDLPDSNEDLYYELSYPVYTDWISFTILDAYPGSQWDDTCISEICAFGKYY